jgi:hypothetical protein
MSDEIHSRIAFGCLISGLVPGVLAPALWPAVVAVTKGQSFIDAYGVTVTEILAIAAIAVIGGLAGCLLVGIPVLAVLERLNANRPYIAAIIGALVAWIAWIVFGSVRQESLGTADWAIPLFLALIGAVCGGLASLISIRR